MLRVLAAADDIQVPQALFVALTVVFLTGIITFLTWIVKSLIVLGKLMARISQQVEEHDKALTEHGALFNQLLAGDVHIHKTAAVAEKETS